MRIVYNSIGVAALAIAAATGPLYGGLILGTNWVVNGDAEGGAGSSDGSVVPVPGWSTSGSTPLFTAVQYQPSEGSFPSISDPGPASRGSNFLAGGPNVALSTGVQTLDVSGFASQIDAGALTFNLSGYLGGWQNQDDYARWTVEFLNGSFSVLSVASLVGPNAAARSNQTGLLSEITSGTIPAGTRNLLLELDLNRLAGAYDDGYADNLSFVANSAGTSSVPEPQSAALAITGLAGLGFLIRRRSRRQLPWP